MAITAAAPEPYTSDDQFTIAAGESGCETSVTVANGTKNAVGATLITTNATVNNGPVERIAWAAAGDSVPLQIAVADTSNEPVFFTGKL